MCVDKYPVWSNGISYVSYAITLTFVFFWSPFPPSSSWCTHPPLTAIVHLRTTRRRATASYSTRTASATRGNGEPTSPTVRAFTVLASLSCDFFSTILSFFCPAQRLPLLFLSLPPTFVFYFLPGLGTLSYADGDKYIGEWKDGKKSGKGELVYINGDKFR